MTSGLRAGVVGVGFMGAVHAHAVRAAGGTVSRVIGSSPTSSQAGAERLGAAGASESVEELVWDAEVDIVHVCTPNHLHHQVAAAALKAGKPVVCEKPLATTLEDALALVDLARSAGVVAAVPFVYRFHPMVREARARIARGDLGEVTLVHGSYLQDWLAQPQDTNWRVDPATGGPSRAFADIGVHWCDLAEFVTGHRITRIAGRALSRFGRTTEDAVALSFGTDRGAIGSLVVSQVSHGRDNRLRLTVDGASSAFGFDQENPDVLWVGRRGSTTLLSRGGADAAPEAARLSYLPPGHNQGYQDAFDAFVRDVHTAVTEPAPDGLPTFADGLRAVRVTDAVMRAISSDEWVDVQPRDEGGQ